MPDNKRLTKLDRRRIDVNDPGEVRSWCKSFGVTKPRLLAAVKAVGTSARKVRDYLKTDKYASGEVAGIALSP